MIIEATIKKIKWHKSTKTAFICDVYSTDLKFFTVTFFCRKLDGEKIEINRNCRFIGSWVNHPKYGKQFKATDIEIIPYHSVKSISYSKNASNLKKRKSYLNQKITTEKIKKPLSIRLLSTMSMIATLGEECRVEIVMTRGNLLTIFSRYI